jgi:hypothetical protein
LARLLEVALDGGIRGGTVFHCIAEGEAGEGVIVSCFDGCKPGERDWVTGRGVVELDKNTDAGEVICIGGLRECSGGGHGVGEVNTRVRGSVV